jgi:outer membrane receptor protein involved in Fe transport
MKLSTLPFIVPLLCGLTPVFAQTAPQDQTTLEEVIVTAQKSAQPLLDVPIPVTAIAAATLVDNNEVDLQNFYTKFPSLSIDYAQQSAVNLVVRGLPASITVDDVPLSITSYLEEAGGLAFDLDPSGLKQIELLRGPQGTLYGADSEGGLLRYVTADPTTDSVSGRLDAGVSTIANGSQPGWDFRGSANVPVSSDAGLLFDGFARQDPGYIDNPTLGINGLNLSHTYGGHLAFLWTPTDALSSKFGAFLQVARGGGTNDVDVGPGLGPYDQNYIAGVGPYERLSQLYSETINYKFGNFQLTSVTGYVWTGFADSYDGTSTGAGPLLEYGIPGTSFTGFGQPGVLIPEDGHSSQFSQEVRLLSHIGKIMDVLLGGFYDSAYGVFGENLFSSNPRTGQVAGDFDFVGFGSAVKDYAAFANLTAHATTKLQIQFGGRYEWDRFYSYGTTFAGPGTVLLAGIATSAPTVVPSPNGVSRKFTYLISPQYKLTQNTMLYVRVASGYAPGTPNPSIAGVPAESQPDTVTDYELGAKADLLDHRLSFDTSAYYAKHTDIQAGLVSQGGFYYFGNSGSATVEGLELSTQLRPATGLSVSGWVTWDESKASIPPTSSLYSTNGQSLPYFPKWSGNLSIDQQFPVGSFEGFAGATVAYIAARGGGGGLVFPSYAKADLHVGLERGDWTARLYANNVANKRGIINGGPATLIPDSFYYITPRVIGLQFTRSF